MNNRILQRVASGAVATTLLGFGFLAAIPALAATSALSSWSFNETDGAQAVDSIAGNNGVGAGDSLPGPSVEVPYMDRGNTGSMLFSGENYFKMANTLSGDFSICAWVKTSSGGYTNHWESAPIAHSEVGGVGYDYGFGINGYGKLAFGNGGLLEGIGFTDTTIAGNTVINDNLWHHTCVTRNNSNGQVDLYVDGKLDGTGTTGTGLLTANSEVWVGDGQDGNAEYQGLIDELSFYSTVLGAADVEEIFSPSPPIEEEEQILDSEENLADTGYSADLALLISSALLLSGLTLLLLSRRRA